MDMEEHWVRRLQAWAAANESVRELWLFGSRAKGTSHPKSDVDIALALTPPDIQHNMSLFKYLDLGDQWQHELETIVGRHVSLEAIEPGSPYDAEVRNTGKLLWARK